MQRSTIQVAIVAKAATAESQVSSFDRSGDILMNITDFSTQLPICLHAFEHRILLYNVPVETKKDIIHNFLKLNHNDLIRQVRQLKKLMRHDQIKALCDKLSAQLENNLVELTDAEILIQFKKSSREYYLKMNGDNFWYDWMDGVANYKKKASQLLADYQCNDQVLTASSRGWQQIHKHTVRVPFRNNALIAITLVVAALSILTFQNHVDKSYKKSFVANTAFFASIFLAYYILANNWSAFKKRDKIPAPKLSVGFDTLNAAVVNALIQFQCEKKKPEFKEYSAAGLRAQEAQTCSFPEEKPKHEKVKTKKDGTATISEDSAVGAIEDKQPYNDFRSQNGSWYLMLKGNSVVRMNAKELQDMHPASKDGNAPKVIEAFFDIIKADRSISPPKDKEIKSHNSPFKGMDGKVRLAGSFSAYRLALKARIPTPIEVTDGVDKNAQVYSPKKIIQHNRKGYS